MLWYILCQQYNMQSQDWYSMTVSYISFCSFWIFFSIFISRKCTTSPVFMPPDSYCCKRGCSAVYWDDLLHLGWKTSLRCLQGQSTIAWGGRKRPWPWKDCLLPGIRDQEVHHLQNWELEILQRFHCNENCTWVVLHASKQLLVLILLLDIEVREGGGGKDQKTKG